MSILLSASIVTHGQVGAWDEIALIAAGLAVLVILLFLLLRGRQFEPEYADEETGTAASETTQEE